MSIRVRLIDARADGAEWIDLELEAGATVGQAIGASRLQGTQHLPQKLEGRVGIYGKLVPLSHPLRDGDRIELYRPLLGDPKAVRRARAQKR